MKDPLFARSQLAIEESCRLREERRVLADAREERLIGIKLARLESAMTRSEVKALRDNVNE